MLREGEEDSRRLQVCGPYGYKRGFGGMDVRGLTSQRKALAKNPKKNSLGEQEEKPHRQMLLTGLPTS